MKQTVNFLEVGHLWVLRTLKLAAVVILFLFGAGSMHAQLTTADILGTVTEPTGAVVANARVELRNIATNVTRVVTTDESGNYTFPLLQPGHYSIKVTVQGFKAFNTPDLAVEACDVRAGS